MVTFETEGVSISRVAADEMFPARSRYHVYMTLLPEVWLRAKVVLSEKTEVPENVVQLSLKEGVLLSLSLLNQPFTFDCSLEVLSDAERVSLTWVRLSFELHSENSFSRLPEGGVLSKTTFEESVVSV